MGSNREAENLKWKQPERGRLKKLRSAVRWKTIPRDVARRIERYNQASKDFSYKYAKSARTLKGIFGFGYATTKSEMKTLAAMIAKCDRIIREGRAVIETVNRLGLAAGNRSSIKVIENGIKTARAFRNHYSRVKPAWEAIEPGMRISEIKTISKQEAVPHIRNQLKMMARSSARFNKDYERQVKILERLKQNPNASQMEFKNAIKALIKTSDEFIKEGRTVIGRIKEFGLEQEYQEAIVMIKKHVDHAETYKKVWETIISQ